MAKMDLAHFTAQQFKHRRSECTNVEEALPKLRLILVDSELPRVAQALFKDTTKRRR